MLQTTDRRTQHCSISTTVVRSAKKIMVCKWHMIALGWRAHGSLSLSLSLEDRNSPSVLSATFVTNSLMLRNSTKTRNTVVWALVLQWILYIDQYAEVMRVRKMLRHRDTQVFRALQIRYLLTYSAYSPVNRCLFKSHRRHYVIRINPLTVTVTMWLQL